MHRSSLSEGAGLADAVRSDYIGKTRLISQRVLQTARKREINLQGCWQAESTFYFEAN